MTNEVALLWLAIIWFAALWLWDLSARRRDAELAEPKG